LWEVPKYESKHWEKVDTVTDNVLTLCFDNKVINKIFSKVDNFIQNLDIYAPNFDKNYKSHFDNEEVTRATKENYIKSRLSKEELDLLTPEKLDSLMKDS